jgi:hypothetical protein
LAGIVVEGGQDAVSPVLGPRREFVQQPFSELPAAPGGSEQIAGSVHHQTGERVAAIGATFLDAEIVNDAVFELFSFRTEFVSNSPAIRAA